MPVTVVVTITYIVSVQEQGYHEGTHFVMIHSHEYSVDDDAQSNEHVDEGIHNEQFDVVSEPVKIKPLTPTSTISHSVSTRMYKTASTAQLTLMYRMVINCGMFQTHMLTSFNPMLDQNRSRSCYRELALFPSTGGEDPHTAVFSFYCC